MRPTPTRLPDEMLATACRTLGVEGLPDDALLNPALRAAVQAAVRAHLAGHPAARVTPRSSLITTPLGFDRKVIDIKRRAANDKDD